MEVDIPKEYVSVMDWIPISPIVVWQLGGCRATRQP